MNSKGLISRGLIGAGVGLTAVGLASGVALADPVYPVPPPPVPVPAQPVNLAAATVPGVPAPPPPAAPAVPVMVTAPVMPDVPAPAANFAADYVDDLATNGYGGFGGYSGSNALAMGYAACSAGSEWDDQVAAVQNAAGGAMNERDAKFIVQSAHIYIC